MKKLLCLVLVLAMGSLATAGLQLVAPQTVKPSDVFTVTLVNDAPFLGAPGMGWVTADLGRAEIAGPATIDVPDRIPGNWTIAEYGFDPEPIMWWEIVNTVPGVGTTLAGDLLSITLHCTGPGDVIVQVWNTDATAPIASVIIHQIPEPASMLLLGLGGLFLRRK